MNNNKKGKITISRIHSNAAERNNTIVISVEDGKTYRQKFIVELTPQDFALALTGLASVDCEYILTERDD